MGKQVDNFILHAKLNKVWAVLLRVLFVLVLCRLVCPFVFANNDDFYLKAIAAGEVTGSPESHLFFLNIWYGRILSLLYTIAPAISWYGVLFTVLYGCVLYVAIWCVCKGNYMEQLFWLGILTIVMFPFLAKQQFTTLAFLLAGAAILSFLEADLSLDTKSFLKSQTGTFLLLAASFCIRSDSCLLMLPVAGLIFLVKFAFCRDTKTLKNACCFAGVVIAILAVFGISQWITYDLNPEWKDFKAFSTARANIHDYEGYPSFEEHQDLYAELGISKEDYEAVSQNYLMLTQQFSTETMETLAEVSARERQALTPSVVISRLISYWSRKSDAPMNWIVLGFFLLVLLRAILKRRKDALWKLGVLLAGAVIIWGYLSIVGRCPIRVSQGIHMAFLMILLGIWKQIPEEETVKTDYITLCLMAVLLCMTFASLIAGDRSCLNIRRENKGLITFSRSYEEFCDAICQEKDKLYLADTMSFSYFTQDVLEGTGRGRIPLVLTGGWLSHSPWYEQALSCYGLTCEKDNPFWNQAIGREDLYFVFQEGIAPDYLQNNLTEAFPDCRLTKTGQIETSGGIIFALYQITD